MIAAWLQFDPRCFGAVVGATAYLDPPAVADPLLLSGLDLGVFVGVLLYLVASYI